MSLAAVVRHDLLLVRRSSLGQAVLLLGAAVPALGALLGISSGRGFGPPAGFRTVLLYSWLAISAVYPILALGSATTAIAGERDTGTLRVFGGLPISRETILDGKFLARLLILETAAVVGLVGLVIVLELSSVTIQPGRLAGFCLFTLLLVACYVALGMAVTAAVQTQGRAVAVGFGLLIVTIGWTSVAPAAGDMVSLSETGQNVLRTLTPFGAYGQAISDERAILGAAVDTPLLGTGSMATILLAWTVLAVVAARRWFRRAEL